MNRQTLRFPWTAAARSILASLIVALAIPVSRFTFAASMNWQQFADHRRILLDIPERGRTGFSEMAATVTGIGFTNRLADERSLTNQIFLNGSGVAAGDVDGDGRCDLFFSGLDSPNILYRNLGGWRFEEFTGDAGVACADQASTGSAFADIDGDGDLDLLINGVARGTRLFLNDGTGRFEEATTAAGLGGASGGTSLALADLDGDGRLDLYVVNYRNDTMRDMPDIRFTVGVTNGVYRLLTVNGRSASAPDLAGRFTFDRSGGVLENGQADTLFRNAGNGRFTPVSWTEGAFLNESGERSAVPFDWGLSAMFRDLNGDAAPDLYVCNDFQSPDRLWINDGSGRFRAAPAETIRQTSLFSMGVDFADLDRDGFDDFFVADMLSRDHARRQVQVMDAMAFSQFRKTGGDRPQTPRNTLFRNRGNHTFAELARFSGLDASEWSWCPVFLDVDLDGYEDLLITTGHWRDAQNADLAREIEQATRQARRSPREQLELRKRFPKLDTPNVAFRNNQDLTFTETGVTWGFDSRRISQGMALADLDNDGDLDAVINCLNDGPLLLRNESVRPRIAVRLRGRPPNTRGVGARIRVVLPDLPVQSQEMICGGRYLSSDDFQRTFAAGSSSSRATIEVLWRDGARTVLTNAPVNHLYEIQEPPASTVSARFERPPPASTGNGPWFEEISGRLGNGHWDEPFDDFQRQPLLPRSLSQLGPGVAWFDFNGDGWEDLFIGAGKGGRLGVLRNDGKGGFVPQRAKAFQTPADRDMTTVLGWRPNPTNRVLLIGLANYENPITNAPALREFSVVTGASNEDLLRTAASTGPIAMGDWDADGDLDLFIGGRVVAGRYPEAASSALLRNDGGRLQHDAEGSRILAGAGLVSGATFTDLDGDGRPELVLACEWGPLRVFKFDHPGWVEWKPPVRWAGADKPSQESFTLGDLTGWWNSVAAGDFDGDGRFDLAAGNWGRNTSHRRFADQPLRLYFAGSGLSEGLPLIEAHFDPGLRKIVPARDWATLSAAFPMLQSNYRSFSAFSSAGISDLQADDLPPLREVEARTLDSMVFLNRDGYFEAHPLPSEAQWSPVFGIAAGDLDGDGQEDLIFAQNFFAVSPSESRHDAGCGLWLRGDGRGGFIAVPPSESGLAIYGQGRGAALCDFDRDGRIDFVVGQNNGPTRLFRNLRARPGLRVHLEGPPENLQAVGASVRWIRKNGTMGPAHEIRLGGGYWSQNSGDLILGIPKETAAIQIRWPGGPLEEVPIQSDNRMIARTFPSFLIPK